MKGEDQEIRLKERGKNEEFACSEKVNKLSEVIMKNKQRRKNQKEKQLGKTKRKEKKKKNQGKQEWKTRKKRTNGELEGNKCGK